MGGWGVLSQEDLRLCFVWIAWASDDTEPRARRGAYTPSLRRGADRDDSMFMGSAAVITWRKRQAAND